MVRDYWLMVRVRDRERTRVRVRVLGCRVEHGFKVYGVRVRWLGSSGKGVIQAWLRVGVRVLGLG